MHGPTAPKQIYGMVEGLTPPCQRVINEYATKRERLVNSAPIWPKLRHLGGKEPIGEVRLKG